MEDNKLTLEEQKLAVCEKLPELIQITPWQDFGADSVIKTIRWRKSRMEINWPTEGLQVCHEAEKLLLEDEWATYSILLHQATCRIPCNSPTCGYTLHATYEQRLETLCRIWWPENSKT